MSILIEIVLRLGAAGYGLVSAAGVFTVFVAIGLIPRFAGRTHTADHVILYEEMVIAGTVFGGILSLFQEQIRIGCLLQKAFVDNIRVAEMFGNICLGVFGLGAGMFIGCLALAIAEILDSIPILTRRIGFRHGIGLAVLSIAAGKLIGSLLYFGKLYN